MQMATPRRSSTLLQSPGFSRPSTFCKTRLLGKRPRASIYSLKHRAERHSAAWLDGGRFGTGYVTNGDLIAAGIYLGFEWEHDGAHGSRDILLDVDLRKLEVGERTGGGAGVTLATRARVGTPPM